MEYQCNNLHESSESLCSYKHRSAHPQLCVLVCGYALFFTLKGRQIYQNSITLLEETVLDKAMLSVWPGRWTELVEHTAECVWEFTNNKPVLCIFVSVLMSGNEAVALHALFRPLASPVRASSHCPACSNCSSSRGILHIIASLNALFQCFWKDLLRRHHAAALRESYQEPGHRG